LLSDEFANPNLRIHVPAGGGDTYHLLFAVNHAGGGAEKLPIIVLLDPAGHDYFTAVDSNLCAVTWRGHEQRNGEKQGPFHGSLQTTSASETVPHIRTSHIGGFSALLPERVAGIRANTVRASFDGATGFSTVSSAGGGAKLIADDLQHHIGQIGNRGRVRTGISSLRRRSGC
jgi:hypothetical protein